MPLRGRGSSGSRGRSISSSRGMFGGGIGHRSTFKSSFGSSSSSNRRYGGGGGRARPDPFQVALNSRPATGQTRVVFPWDTSSSKFNLSEYNPTVYGSHITQNEIEQFFQKVEQCPDYKPTNVCWIYSLIPLIFFGGMAGMIVLIISLARSGSIMVSFMPMIMVFGMTFLVLVMICIASSIRMKSLRARKIQFDNICL